MRNVEFSNQADKALQKLYKKSLDVAKLVVSHLEVLEENPEPPNSKRLVNGQYYSLRIRDYRIIYEFDDHMLHIVLIEKRDKVYKRLEKLNI